MQSVYTLVEELGLLNPVGHMLNPEVTLKFIDYLPEVKWYEAYVALMLIRSKGLKEKFGFKGTDHSLEIKIVPGYRTYPKLSLYLLLRRMSVLAQHSSEYYTYERYINGNEVEIYRVPPELVTIMVSPNVSNWVKASTYTVREYIESLMHSVLNPESASKLVRRIDVRLGANAMKYTSRRFHMIDIDDPALVQEIEERVHEYLGCIPAKITTVRGAHLLVDLKKFERDQKLAKKWFNEFVKYLEDLNKQYEQPVVEYKKVFQEPVPGIKYRGIVPKFFRGTC